MSGRRGLLRRVAEAVGLAVRPTGKIDHTWSSRNQTNSAAYEAGTVNRQNRDWRAGLTSSTLAIIESLDVMLARSRWLVRNDAYAASAAGGYRRRVVGGGITARASARHPQTGEMLDVFNSQADLLWRQWAEDPRACDIERTKSLSMKQGVWMDELFAAGGVLLRAVYQPRADEIGLAVQEIEYEQLDTTIHSFGANPVYHGIETDRYGAPVAYHVYTAEHPLEDVPSQSRRIEADGMFHLFRPTRIRQRIGAPMMAAVMPSLRNLAMYELYTLSKARTEAAYHGFIKRGAGSTAAIDTIRKRIGAAPPSGESDVASERLIRTENGLFPILGAEEDVQFPPTTQPNSVYGPYVAEHLKKIAAGTGLDLPTVARWYADGNFNTQRAAKLEIEAEVEAIQDLLFMGGALRWLRKLWLEIAIRENRLSATGYRESARWRAAYLTTNWQGPPLRTVDPLKDEAAWDMRYRSMRGTPQEYYNQHGRDIRDVFSEWQEARALAEQYGLGDLFADYFGLATASAPKAGMRPDGSGGDANPADAAPGGTPAAGRARMPDAWVRRMIDDAVLAGTGENDGNGNGNGRH